MLVEIGFVHYTTQRGNGVLEIIVCLFVLFCYISTITFVQYSHLNAKSPLS